MELNDTNEWDLHGNQHGDTNSKKRTPLPPPLPSIPDCWNPGPEHLYLLTYLFIYKWIASCERGLFCSDYLLIIFEHWHQ